ncbi:hypothetical protein KAR91_01470 [Candidatus Pacearchaeota archaeon]|nr:hypothetical protein [Candidatus Pacearchaeota archaeon]
MDSEHTKEPWVCHGTKPYEHIEGRIKIHIDEPYKSFSIEQVVDTPDGSRITTFLAEVVRCGDMSDKELEDNANRIVSCVNACAGINPESLPALFDAVKDIINHFPDSTLHRYEKGLLEAFNKLGETNDK